MTLDSTRDFTINGYQELVKYFLAKGYSVKNYDTYIKEEKHIVLRHDVDMSLDYAEKIAQAEKDINVTSTFFVLIRHSLYNILSKKNAESLLRIKNMGHEIGLHFDASIYDENDYSSLNQGAELECQILESIINNKVNIISFHRPSQKLIGYDHKLAGRIHTYMPEFLNEMHYFADSRGLWRFGHPIDSEHIHSIQLLTHPIWWVFDKEKTTQEKLDIFVESEAEIFKRNLAANCLSYIINE